MTDMMTRPPLKLALAALGLLLGGLIMGWAVSRVSGGGIDQVAFDKRVHDYIVEHPEVLVEASERLKTKGYEKQLSQVADQVERPFPGAVLGNPAGSVTLVEFTDFACTYCRASVAEVQALIARNPDLKVVIRELPVIAPTSPNAARWGLAAAEQGRYPQFHEAMFAAGGTDTASIESAARRAGLDLERARGFIADPRVSAEIAANLELARKLGIDGTPSFVTGEQLLVGAVDRETLSRAIAKTRGS